MKWLITVGGGYGSFEFEGTKQEAETMRKNKARSEGTPAIMHRLTQRALDELDMNCKDCPFVVDFRRCDECSKNPTRQ